MFASITIGVLMMKFLSASTNFQSCLFLPNVELHEGTVHEFDTPRIKECCVACSTSSCCIAYTYDKKNERCYLKNSIGYSTEDSTKTSGLKPNSYFGRGVRLNNVKIQGDQMNKIELRTYEECKNYCIAYKVFSWVPAEDKDESNGVCGCTMRIKTIQYAFGCSSEIVPNNP